MAKKKSTFFKDFRDFIAKGNVIDMAVGVVIGGAFGKITSSLVSDIINPVIGLLIGTEDLKAWEITLKEAVVEAETEIPAVTMKIGNFLATILDFLIIAFAIFCVLRVMVKAKKAAEKLSKKDEDQEEDK